MKKARKDWVLSRKFQYCLIKSEHQSCADAGWLRFQLPGFNGYICNRLRDPGGLWLTSNHRGYWFFIVSQEVKHPKCREYDVDAAAICCAVTEAIMGRLLRGGAA